MKTKQQSAGSISKKLAESDCVSAKVKYLMENEGMDQDQAVAYAINYCKEKHNHSAGNLSEGSVLADPPGKGYSFSRSGDTYIIHDIPIMAEVPKGARGNSHRIGLEWMTQAVNKATQRFKQDRYKAPLHIYHHDSGTKPEAAGFVVPKTVKLMEYEGKKIWAIFADFEVKPSVFNRIKKQELPYRSVEILSWKKNPEISSVAMLNDEVPFFRFEVLTLGEEKEEEVTPAFKFSKGAAIAVRSCNSGAAILFSLDGGSFKMAAKRKKVASKLAEVKEEEEIKAKLDDEPREEADVDEYRKGEKEGEKKEAEKMGEEIEEKVEEEEKIEGKMDADDTSIAILQLLQAIAAKLGVGVEEEVEAEEVEAPVEEVFGDGSIVAKLSGKVAALESKQAKRDRDEKLSTLVDTAMGKLSEWQPGAEVRTQLVELAEQSNSPRKTIDTWVKSFQSNVPKSPPSTLEDYEGDFGSSAGDHPEVLKFMEKGPETLAAAREASKMFDELGGKVRSSREAFITANLDSLESNGTFGKRS